MKRMLVLLYGVASYAVFFAVFLYAIAFLGNFLVPNSIDAAPRGALGEAIAINVALLTIFALQHSVMARPAFKRWWTRIIPTAAERSTYVLLSSLALILLFWQWRPIGAIVWDVQSEIGRAAIYAGYGVGWVVLLAATFLINHFDLFGLRQSWLYFRGRPYTELAFRTPALYRVVRHPIYVGWLMIFWCAPTMTAAHLLFAMMTTAYILIAIRFEERDLVSQHGTAYEEYRRKVPMLLPSLRMARGDRPRTASGKAGAA